MFSFFQPFLYLLPEEKAHHLAISALKNGIYPAGKTAINIPSLSQNIFGLNFTNPVGLAAGFDKNAEALAGLQKCGFGFIEAGTVTPLPQLGNPKPRLFRLKQDQAIINRMGFNNDGGTDFARNLTSRKKRNIVGANIGKNKLTENAASDYTKLLHQLYGLSDYITINISSPNTPGLRDLQNQSALQELLASITKTRHELHEKTSIYVPLLLKIAPDITYDEKKNIAETTIASGVDGLIVGNTTISMRNNLKNRQNANQTGGLSGKPLFELSTNVLRDMYRLTEGKIPIIGAGGISSGSDAYAKIRAGASLVQIYTAIIYRGFGIVPDICNDLTKLLKKDGFTNISEAIGVDT